MTRSERRRVRFSLDGLAPYGLVPLIAYIREITDMPDCDDPTASLEWTLELTEAEERRLKHYLDHGWAGALVERVDE